MITSIDLLNARATLQEYADGKEHTGEELTQALITLRSLDYSDRGLKTLFSFTNERYEQLIDAITPAAVKEHNARQSTKL